MILKFILQKTQTSLEFINTEFDTDIPIDPNQVVQYEQMVYDFVSNTDLLGAFSDQEGIYEVVTEVNFQYKWHAVDKTVTLDSIKTNVVYLNKLEGYTP